MRYFMAVYKRTEKSIFIACTNISLSNNSSYKLKKKSDR